MRLSIIIPRYKETNTELLPLMASIRAQTGTDLSELEIIISNDNPNDKIVPDTLGLNAKIIHAEENKGPGVARQRGLDAAEGDFIMFCDADDVLHSVGVISAFEHEFRVHPECDYMQSQWLEELKVDGEYKYITHQMENTWMHGKVFRHELLNTARFHEDLRVHEDSYFLTLIADSAKARRQLNVISYVWKWRDDSITRTKGQLYEYKDFPEFIRAICLSNSELKKRNSPMLQYHVTQHLIYCYFVLMQDKWFLQPEYRTQSIDALKVGMVPFWEIYNSTPKEELFRIYNEEREKIYKNEIEKYTLQDFANAIMKGEI